MLLFQNADVDNDKLLNLEEYITFYELRLQKNKERHGGCIDFDRTFVEQEFNLFNTISEDTVGGISMGDMIKVWRIWRAVF